DQHNCPIVHGSGVPSRPKDWGIWALCHRGLRTWREMIRAGRASKLEPTGGRIYPVYDMTPVLNSDRPDLSLLRSSGLNVCRPRDGHRFLACRFPDLKIRCFAVLCYRRNYASNGKLTRYFFSSNPSGFQPFENWLEAAAGDFYVEARKSGDNFSDEPNSPHR